METPAWVQRAVLLVWLQVLLGTAVTVLAVIFDDDLVAAWAGGRGLSIDDRRVPPSFTPVVVVLYVVVVTLVLVLLSFVRGGHNWARHCLAAVVVLVAIATVSGMRVGPPSAFIVCAVVSLVVDVAAVACLYHPETSRFLAQTAVPRTHA